MNRRSFQKPDRQRWVSVRRLYRGAMIFTLGLLAVGAVSMVAVAEPESDESILISNGKRPVAATSLDGEAVVIWERPSEGIQGQGFDAFGMPVGREFNVFGASQANPTHADVAYLPSGDFVVAWENQEPSGSDILAVRFESFGMPVGRTFQVSSQRALSAPALAADDQGRFAVVWKGTRNPRGRGAHRYFLRLYDHQGQPIGEAESFGRARGAGPPSIAMRPDGQSLVVWQNVARSIDGQVFDSLGMPVGRTFRVSEAGRGWDSSPAATVSLDGSYTVVWEQKTLPRREFEVFSRQVTSSGMPVGRPFKVSEISSLGESTPAVIADGQGNSLATWRCLLHGGELSSDIFARRLSISGMPVGRTFRVSGEQTVNGALLPQASLGGDQNDFLVLWQDNGSSFFDADEAHGDACQILGRYLTLPMEGGGGD